MSEQTKLTVGDLIDLLSKLPRDAELRCYPDYSLEEKPLPGFKHIGLWVVVDEGQGQVIALVFSDNEMSPRFHVNDEAEHPDDFISQGRGNLLPGRYTRFPEGFNAHIKRRVT